MCSTCEELLWGKQEGRGKDGGPESWVQFRLPRVWERVTGQPGVRELVLSASPAASQGRSLPSGLPPSFLDELVQGCLLSAPSWDLCRVQGCFLPSNGWSGPHGPGWNAGQPFWRLLFALLVLP